MTASSTAADLVPGPARPGRPWLRRTLELAGAVIVPAVASPLVLRYAFPSRLGGAGGGLAGLLAWLVDRYPLFVGLAIFLVISEAGRYWLKRWRGDAPSAPRAAPGFSLSSARRLSIGLAAVVVVAFVTRSSLVATFKIVGPSMLPTLEIGDRVLVDRRAYGLTLPFSKAPLHQKLPQRGDLVVFQAHGMVGASGAESFVKRVIGLPGDRVSFEQGNLIINGWPVPACDAGPYVEMVGRLTVRGRLTVEYLNDTAYLTVRKPIEAPFGGYTVKPGEVFVVGDDRGISSDSRLWNEGHGAGVPLDILEGRVSRVLFGARRDGRLDFARVLAPPLDLKVRMPGLDMRKTDDRIHDCLSRRPPETWPPATSMAPAPASP